MLISFDVLAKLFKSSKKETALLENIALLSRIVDTPTSTPPSSITDDFSEKKFIEIPQTKKSAQPIISSAGKSFFVSSSCFSPAPILSSKLYSTNISENYTQGTKKVEKESKQGGNKLNGKANSKNSNSKKKFSEWSNKHRKKFLLLLAMQLGFFIVKNAKNQYSKQQKAMDKLSADAEKSIQEAKEFLKGKECAFLIELDRRLYQLGTVSPADEKNHKKIEQLLSSTISNLKTQQKKIEQALAQIPLLFRYCKFFRSKLREINSVLAGLNVARSLNQAQLEHKRKNYNDAANQIQEAHKQMQQDLSSLEDFSPMFLVNVKAQVYNWQAKIEANRKNYAQSEEAYNQAISLFVDLEKSQDAQANISIIHTNLSILYSCKGALFNDWHDKLGAHLQALECHKIANDYNPNDPYTQLNYGWGLRLCAKYMEMIDLADSTAEHKKVIEEDRELALSFLNKSKKNKDTWLQSQLYHGIILMDAQQPEEALKLFDEALKKDQNHITLLRRKALALSYLQRYPEAIKTLKQAENIIKGMKKNLQATPRHQEWLEIILPTLAAFQGYDAYQRGDIDSAIKYFKSAYQLTEEQPQWRKTYFDIPKKELLSNWQQLVEQKDGAVMQVQKNYHSIAPEKLGVVTHAEYAKLCAHVYCKLDKNAPLPPLPERWEIFSTSQNLKNSSGYQGIAYINKTTQDVVIAHRGTYNLANVKTDINFFLTKHFDGYADAAAVFSKQVEKQIKKNQVEHYRLSHTGHSLGGMIAEVMAYDQKLSAVTFESPGAREILERNIKTSSEPYKKLDPVQEQKIVTYLSDPNLINTAHQHIGRQYRLFQTYKPNESYSEWLLGLLPMISDVQKTGRRHAITQIVNTFGEADKKGAPINYGVVEDWPRGPQDYKSYEQWTEQNIKQGINIATVQQKSFKQKYQVHYDVQPVKDYTQYPIDKIPPHILEQLRVMKDPLKLKSFRSSDNFGKWDKNILDGYSFNGTHLIVNCGLLCEEFFQYIERNTLKKSENKNTNTIKSNVTSSYKGNFWQQSNENANDKLQEKNIGNKL